MLVYQKILFCVLTNVVGSFTRHIRQESCMVDISSATRWKWDEFYQFCHGSLKHVLEDGFIRVQNTLILSTANQEHHYKEGLNLAIIHFKDRGGCYSRESINFRIKPRNQYEDKESLVVPIKQYVNSLRPGDVVVGVTFGGAKILSVEGRKLMEEIGVQGPLVDDRDFIFVFVRSHPKKTFFKTVEARCQMVFAHLAISGYSKKITEIASGVALLYDRPW